MKNSKLAKNNAATKYDLADKSHHPMGGFPHYGDVKQDIVRLKGCCIGLKESAHTAQVVCFAQGMVQCLISSCTAF